MKHLVFISTLEHLPWGGCEDLWYKTALIALGKGHKVAVLTFRHSIMPEHLLRLQEAGALLFQLERPHAAGLLQRIRRRVLPTKLHEAVLRRVSELFKGEPFAAIVSQAGGFDFSYTYLDEIAQWLKEKAHELHLVVQNVPDLGFTLPVPAAEKQANIFRQAKAVCFVSHRNCLSAERILAQKLTNARMVNNPLNVPHLPAVLDYPASATHVSMAVVAALRCFHKGQDVLFQALAGNEWRSRAWKLNLYGKGPDKEYLHKLAAFYDLEDKISFHGHVRDIREVWLQNQIHILPSLGEGTPLALIESMYCGRPAITSDVGGNAEYCKDGLSGFICDYPTPAALSKVLDIAWRRKDDWEQMGKTARESIDGNYDVNGAQTWYEMITEE